MECGLKTVKTAAQSYKTHTKQCLTYCNRDSFYSFYSLAKQCNSFDSFCSLCDSFYSFCDILIVLLGLTVCVFFYTFDCFYYCSQVSEFCCMLNLLCSKSWDTYTLKSISFIEFYWLLSFIFVSATGRIRPTASLLISWYDHDLYTFRKLIRSNKNYACFSDQS